MTEEKIIDRIRKLLNLSGNNPSEKEAAAAAAMAERLIKKHKLDRADLAEDHADADQQQVEAEYDHRFYYLWEGSLAATLSKRHGVAVYRKGKKIRAIGTRENLNIFFALFGYIRKSLRALALGHKSKASFGLGAVARIRERLEAEDRQQDQQDQQQETDTRDRYAVIIRKENAAALQEMYKRHPRMRKGSRARVTDDRSYAAGYRQGGKYDLHGRTRIQA